MVAEALALWIELGNPFVESGLDSRGILFAQLSLGPVTITILPPLEYLEKLGDPCACDLRRFLEFCSFRENAPNPTRLSVSSLVPQGILGVTLHRVVPVANVHGSSRPISQVNRNEAQVGGEDDIAEVLLIIAKITLVPLQYLYAVGRLVAHLDHLPLQFLGPIWEINEFLTTNT